MNSATSIGRCPSSQGSSFTSLRRHQHTSTYHDPEAAHEKSPRWLQPILYHRTCANKSTAPGGRLGSRHRNPSAARSRRRLPPSHLRPPTFHDHPPPRSVPWTATGVIPQRLRLDSHPYPRRRLPGGGAKSRLAWHHSSQAGRGRARQQRRRKGKTQTRRFGWVQ